MEMNSNEYLELLESGAKKAFNKSAKFNTDVEGTKVKEPKTKTGKDKLAVGDDISDLVKNIMADDEDVIDNPNLGEEDIDYDKEIDIDAEDYQNDGLEEGCKNKDKDKNKPNKENKLMETKESDENDESLELTEVESQIFKRLMEELDQSDNTDGVVSDTGSELSNSITNDEDFSELDEAFTRILESDDFDDLLVDVDLNLDDVTDDDE